MHVMTALSPVRYTVAATFSQVQQTFEGRIRRLTIAEFHRLPMRRLEHRFGDDRDRGVPVGVASIGASRRGFAAVVGVVKRKSTCTIVLYATTKMPIGMPKGHKRRGCDERRCWATRLLADRGPNAPFY